MVANGPPAIQSGETGSYPAQMDTQERVRARYGAFAEAGGHQESCCGATATDAGYALDQGLYAEAELALVPGVTQALSRGCGNPTGFADVRPGDVVLDLGCGGGTDAILAATKVGPQGRVVGIDFTPQMVEAATKAMVVAGLANVQLITEDIAHTHLPDGSAGVVISNCVINLCPDKSAVYQEAFRLLQAGGRLAVSDIVLSEAIAPELGERFHSAGVGCLAGAVVEDDYLNIVRRAGFKDVRVVARHQLAPGELEAMARCPGPQFSPPASADDLASVAGTVVSLKFTANKLAW